MTMLSNWSFSNYSYYNAHQTHTLYLPAHILNTRISWSGILPTMDKPNKLHILLSLTNRKHQVYQMHQSFHSVSSMDLLLYQMLLNRYPTKILLTLSSSPRILPKRRNFKVVYCSNRRNSRISFHIFSIVSLLYIPGLQKMQIQITNKNTQIAHHPRWMDQWSRNKFWSIINYLVF